MKKIKKTLLILFLAFNVTLNAQIPDSGFAADFNVTAHQPWLSSAGQNANGTYSLYQYLDQGYTVFIDFSAVWCVPCWGAHISGTYDELYYEHGPTGFPGVSPTTTNDVMVFWMEGDPQTASTLLNGGPGSAGNWTEPTPGNQIQYPMFNPDSANTAAIIDNFNILGFPSGVRVCTDRSAAIPYGISWGADSAYAEITDCNASTGIKENRSFDKEIIIYPNPAISSVNVSSKNISKSEIQLFDALGKRMICSFVVSNEDTIILNTESLTSGIYTIKAIDKEIRTTRIIIQH